jgi:adenylate cyclase
MIDSRRPFRLQSFILELKRRRVFRVAMIYGVSGFAVLQAVDILAPALRLPEWTLTLFVVLVLVGFIVAVGLAWAFDLGPDGIRRATEAETAGSTPPPPPSRRRGGKCPASP